MHGAALVAPDYAKSLGTCNDKTWIFHFQASLAAHQNACMHRAFGLCKHNCTANESVPIGGASSIDMEMRTTIDSVEQELDKPSDERAQVLSEQSGEHSTCLIPAFPSVAFPIWCNGQI